MPQNWEIDPATGDYLQEGGAPVETDSLRIPAYIRLKTSRTKWLYSPDTSYGSDFYTFKKRQSTRDASALEAVAERALQPIVDDGRAATIEISTLDTARHGVSLQATITEASGRLDQLLLPSLGV